MIFDSQQPSPDWSTRERYWRRRLGRIQLGAEPVEEQLAKYRRATWVLTAVPLGIASIFVSVFAAFRRADVGVILGAVLMLPIVVLAWVKFNVLERRVREYEQERDEYEAQRDTPRRT